MLKHKKIHIIALAFLFLSSILTAGVTFSSHAGATTIDPGGGTTTTTAPGTLNINASVARINRMTLLMGTTYFYDSNTTDSDWTFKSIGLTCSAEIKYSPTQSTGGRGGGTTGESWNLTYTSPLDSGSGCGPENSKSLTKPTNWTERQYVVFAGGSSDGQFISVKPDNGTVFKKGGTYNGDTVYIQQGVDPYSCPLVIVTNSRSTALIPLEKKDKEADVSNQIKTLFSKELNVSDTACGPTDNDKLGIFSQFGLPESYYNAGSIKDHYETTDFGFGGTKVGSATIYVATIAQAAGIALNGPLKGGGYDSSGSGSNESGATDATPTSCAIDGIGWIVCPVMGFVAKVNDSAFSFLQSFLGIRPSLINSDGTIKAWQAFRDIANVAFVIAFLVIVYSQLTSAGISNYGIKKMLPRIVIAAILVNLSYFICAIMVDVSNILGSSIYSLLKSFDVGATATDPSWQTIVSGPSGILATAATGIAVVLLAIAIFLAPTTLLAFAVVILILIARQAFVILLLVISPLAFVAYLLPNTESWFKKWWKALTATLMVYPIIGAVFGASTLAANILSSTAKTTDDSSLLQLIALGVLAVPLFAVPALLKGSLSAAGSVGQKLANLQDRANRKAGGDVKDRAGKEFKALGDSMTRRALAGEGRFGGILGSRARARARREKRYEGLDRQRKAAETVFGATDARASTRERAALTAEETAGKTKQVLENEVKLDHLGQNAGLHTQAIESGLNLHNAEETHKNEVESEHMRTNPNQYQTLNTSRGEKQNAELETKRDFETSDVARNQSMNRQMLEGQLDIEKNDQKVAFDATGVGRAQAVVKDEVEQVGKAVRADNEAQAVGQNRAVRLQAAAAEANTGAVKAEETALVEELKAGPEAAATVIDGNPDLQEVSVELNRADVQNRVQTQRAGAAKRKADTEYAGEIKTSDTLATTAGGIEGQAGVSQARAVAHQTILDAYRKGVAAESTLMSETREQEILGDTMLGAADVLDQPDEKIAAMGSVIAKRQHMASHIKLWERMAELRKEAQEAYDKTAEGSPERAAAEAKLNKAKNLQQIVMADKSKKPFGIGDEAQGDATVGDYKFDIYQETRKRILTHMSPETLSTMDPDDLSLIYEMARSGKLSEDHIKKVKDAYDAWRANPNISSRLKDKAKALLDPFENFAKGDANAFSDPDYKPKFDEVPTMPNP